MESEWMSVTAVILKAKGSATDFKLVKNNHHHLKSNRIHTCFTLVACFSGQHRKTINEYAGTRTYTSPSPLSRGSSSVMKQTQIFGIALCNLIRLGAAQQIWDIVSYLTP